MKYKVGQKVRIKKWDDMPPGLVKEFGCNCYAGDTGVIVSKNDTAGSDGYDVLGDGNRNSCLCFEQELESLVRVGEQLLLFEL